MEKIENQIDNLVKLQKIDGQIYRLKQKKQAMPAEIESLQELYKEKENTLKAYEDKLKNLQLKRKEKEIDLQSKEENIKKLQAQLYQIKTNQEYTSLQKEIEGLKADNSVLEEEIIQILEEVDQVQESLSKDKKALSQEQKKFEEEKKKIEKDMQETDAQTSSLNEERKSITPNIERSILSKYEKVLENKQGEALVAVVDEACGGCRMKLPPQVINEIRMKDRIVICEQCSRILYIQDF